MTRECVERPVELFRPLIHAPRTAHLAKLVQPDSWTNFDALMDGIWREILARIGRPIAVRDSATRRSVTVLGCIRYVMTRKDGRIHVERLGASPRGRRFKRQHYVFAVDPPCMPTNGIFGELLHEWRGAIMSLAIPDNGSTLLESVVLAFRRAILRSVHWSRLRHAVRDALALDPDTLRLARRSRINVHEECVTDGQYNLVASNRDSMRQIELDAPQLLWLFSLAMLDGDGLPALPPQEALAALKMAVRKSLGLGESAWRLLIHSRRRDFRFILEWLGPGALPDGRWFELRDWLKVLLTLRRSPALPLPVQRIFLHDRFNLMADGSFIIRGARLSERTLRALIEEAERQFEVGTFDAFLETELVDVLSWIASADIELDEAQQRAGWRHLVRRAGEWKHERRLLGERDAMRWDSLIANQTIGSFEVRPLTDVWMLHQESLKNRHCADNYVPDCRAGTVRIFAIHTASGRQAGTVGLVRDVQSWQVLDVRGFANKRPEPALTDVAERIRERYEFLSQLLYTLPTGTPELIPSMTSSMDPENSEEEDSDEYGISPERACPFCGDRFFACSHLLVTVDEYNEGFNGGALMDRLKALLALMWTHALHCANARRVYSGLGDDFDQLVRRIVRDRDKGLSNPPPHDQYSVKLENILYAVLQKIPGITPNYWEFSDGMPGCATCGYDFWSRDTETTIKTIESILCGNG